MLVVTVGHAAGQYDGASHAEGGRGVAPALPLLHLQNCQGDFAKFSSVQYPN